MTFSPRLATWSSTCLVAPVVRLTEPMTAPTPMMMPSIVNSERILFRRSARPAIFNEAKILIAKKCRMKNEKWRIGSCLTSRLLNDRDEDGHQFAGFDG